MDSSGVGVTRAADAYAMERVMTLSSEAEHDVRALLGLASNLMRNLASIRKSSGASGVATIMQRYTDILESSLSTGSLDEALRGANLMTTVNKGVNDIVATAVVPTITASAYELSMAAIKVAERLRAERGGPL